MTTPRRHSFGALAMAAGTVSLGLVALFRSARAGWRMDDDAVVLATIAALVAALGLASLWQSRHRRRSRIGFVGVCVALAGAVIVVGFVIMADQDHQAITTATLGAWTTAGLWLLAAATILAESAFGAPRTRPAFDTVGVIVAVITATLLITAALGPLERELMVRVNSTATVAAAPPSDPPPASRFTGELAWHIDIPYATDAVATDAGIAVSIQGISQSEPPVVRLIDAGAGELRWQHQVRGDHSSPDLTVADGARTLIAEWRGLGNLSWDAESGRRTAVWRSEGNDGLLRSGDPVVAVRSDAVAGLTSGGGLRWRWSGPTGDHQDQAGCNDRTVVGAGEVALVRVTDPCDEGDDLLVGLDADTGAELWRHRQNVQPPLTETVSGRQHISLGDDRREVRARDVDTGGLLWSVDREHRRQDCADAPQLSSSSGTAFLLSCVADHPSQDPASVTGFDLASGSRDWQLTRSDREFLTGIAMDDDRALVVSQPDDREHCSVDLVTASGLRELVPLPVDSREVCHDTSLIKSGGTYFVFIEAYRDSALLALG